MNSINFWPIIVATIVSFIISAVWYSSALFGKEWMSLAGLNDKDISDAKARGVIKLYIAQFLATLISFCILAFIVSVTSSITVGDGALLGFIIWLGFIAVDALQKYLWEKKPLKLIMINSVVTLVNLVIGGMIIGGWK